jgi:hypothetical protein
LSANPFTPTEQLVQLVRTGRDVRGRVEAFASERLEIRRPQNDGNGNKVADQIRIDPARPQKDGDGNKVADLNLIRKDPAPPQKDGDGNKIADLIRIEPARPQDPCLLNTPTGRCFRALPRFYFDKNFKDCSMFWYGGKVKFFSFHYNNNKGFYDFIVY